MLTPGRAFIVYYLKIYLATRVSRKRGREERRCFNDDPNQVVQPAPWSRYCVFA